MAVKVFGADWCHDTTDTIQHLQARSVQFDYIDIEHDRKAASWVREHNGGRERKPTLDINGTVLSVPSFEDLDEELDKQGL